MTPDGIYDQIYLREEWEKVFPKEWNEIQIKPEVIKEALTELFILAEDERPEYLIMLAAPKNLPDSLREMEIRQLLIV